MEEITTIANTGAPSTKTENTNAEEEHVSNNQETDFKSMDSLYSAAADVNREELEKNAKQLDQILTPNGNTILHIYIVSLPLETAKPNKSDQKVTNPKKKSEDGSETQPPEAKFVTKVLEMCPNLLWKANNKGETLLHFAARYGHGDIVKELIEECKKPHNKDQEDGVEPTRLMLGKTNNEAKDTALHEAIRYNHIDVVNKLIEAAPDLPYEANGYGETPLYLAAERGYTEIVEKILGNWKSQSPADRGPMNRTALHAAVVRKEEISRERKVNRVSTLGLRKENAKAKDECDEIKEAGETHLVVATLIVTVTFAAGFTLPGGYIGEDGPNEGAAILTRSAAFQSFVTFDTIAFVLSCSAVFIHLTKALNKDKTLLSMQFANELYLILLAMIAMVFAFATGIYAVLYPNKNLAIAVCVICSVLGVEIFLFIPLVIELIKKSIITSEKIL